MTNRAKIMRANTVISSLYKNLFKEANDRWRHHFRGDDTKEHVVSMATSAFSSALIIISPKIKEATENE